MSKTVTAVIPNYNYARYLAARVASIVDQTYPISELIILDDASTDDSLAEIDRIFKELKATHPHLKTRCLKNRVNSGNVFKQWAKAFELASGDYLWICEADDLCDRHFLAAAMSGFEDRGVVLSYTEGKLIDESGRVLMRTLRPWAAYESQRHWAKSYVASGPSELASVMAVNNTIINVSGVVFRLSADIPYRKYLSRAEDFRLAGDWYFYAEVLSHGKIAYCDRPLNFHRAHQSSVSATTDDLIHYREIVAVQDEIARLVALPAHTRELTNRRRAELIARWDLGAKFAGDSPLISVVVPAYNVENYLSPCLDSLLKQDYPNYEIILVDDGSTDGTSALCDRYAASSPRVKVVHQKNAGLSAARNAGIARAKGAYLALVDGDDAVAPDFLSRLYRAAALADADITLCDFLTTTSPRPAKTSAPLRPEILDGHAALVRLLVGQENSDVVAWNKLYKREVFKGIEYPVGELHEDNLTTYKLFAAAGRVATLPDRLYYYRQRPASIMADQDLLARLHQKERAAKEAIAYLRSDQDLLAAAEVSLLLARFAYLDNIAAGRLKSTDLWRRTVREIKAKKPRYLKNPHLTKKLRLYLALLAFPPLYRLFRRLVH